MLPVTAGVFAETLVVHPHDDKPFELNNVWYWLNAGPDGTRVVLVDEAGVYLDEIENVLRTEVR